MESGRTRKNSVVILAVVALLAGSLWAQQPSPASLRGRELTQLLDDSAALLQKTGSSEGVAFLERNRGRIQRGFPPEVYGLLLWMRSAAVAADFGAGATSTADRARLHEVVDRLDAHFRAVLAERERRLASPDRDNLARYAEANRQLGPPPPEERRVLFLGDSITDGWKLGEYFPGKPYVNRGISGQITGEMLGRMKADVLDLKPAAMVVLAGTNDLARGVALETIQNNLAMIGMLGRAAGIKVIFASILPVGGPQQVAARPPEKILLLNGWIKEHAQREAFTYLDYHSAMKDDKGLLQAELANDGLHPNEAGYKLMAPLAEVAIAEALRPARRGRVPARRDRAAPTARSDRAAPTARPK